MRWKGTIELNGSLEGSKLGEKVKYSKETRGRPASLWFRVERGILIILITLFVSWLNLIHTFVKMAGDIPHLCCGQYRIQELGHTFR